MDITNNPSHKENPPIREPSVFLRSQILTYGILVLLLLGGISLRMLNLTNPPLDFHAWRQLRSAMIARGMYYELAASVNPAFEADDSNYQNGFEILEPRVFERLVAITYLVAGGEHLWIARIYSIMFWAIGGIGVFALARRFTSPQGGLVSVGIFMFSPYSVVASRSFQPDPLMVMWIILSAFALYRWGEAQTWKWAILAGIFSGLAVLIKVFAVFPVSAAAVITVISCWKPSKIFKDVQIWATALIMIVIPAVYYLISIGNLASGYLQDWVFSFQGLLTTPRFYVVWLDYLDKLFDLSVILLGLMAIFFLPRFSRNIMVALWIGYVFIGLSVPSLIITHDYYNLFIIPLIALSFSGLGHLIINKMAQQPKSWQLLFYGVVLISVLYPAWISRNALLSNDYRPEILGWIKMGRELPKGSHIVGITHDYNTRLLYYGGIAVDPWPYAADAEMNNMSGGNSDFLDPYWEQFFKEKTKDADYFLVTIAGELDAQPVLKNMLDQYSSVEGDGYILYDLKKPK
jgi:hypothetical protein